MKTTLPTLSEVIDITANMAYDGNFITNHIWDYNDFLKQPLKLEMFIPCKDGEPLEEPKDKELSDFADEKQKSDWLKQCKEYQQALDRVIFKVAGSITKQSQLPFNIDLLLAEGGYTISDLCEKVELTDKEYERLNLR